MERRVKALERTTRVQTAVILVLAVALVWVFLQSERGDILHTKGLVIHDDEGNPRMAMGFPISNEHRKRTDTLNGLVLMDEDGMDRIHLGPHGKLFLSGKYHDRMNEGWSLFFNDRKGEERSGYGFSDEDNSVGLGMDYGGEYGGEAIYLYAAPKLAFMAVNADLQKEEGIRDRIVLWHDTDKDLSLVKLSDSHKDGSIILRAEQGRNSVTESADSLSSGQ